MSLADPGRTNKGQVLVSMDCCQRWQSFEPVDILALDDREIEVVEGLWILQWKPAHPK